MKSQGVRRAESGARLEFLAHLRELTRAAGFGIAAGAINGL
jgi:hypothetical protein